MSQCVVGSRLLGEYRIDGFVLLCGQIPRAGCTSVDLEAGALRIEALLGKMSYMIHLREWLLLC